MSRVEQVAETERQRQVQRRGDAESPEETRA
jgi:hypothetical protein